MERGCAGRGHDAAAEIERSVGSRFPDQRGPEGDAGKSVELREPCTVGGTGRGQVLVRGRVADSDLHADGGAERATGVWMDDEVHGSVWDGRGGEPVVVPVD